MLQEKLIEEIKQIPEAHLAEVYDFIHYFRLGLAAQAAVKPTQRPIGLAKGQFVVPKDFFEPLPDEILNDFEGKV